jgi:hypothetical protein
MIEHTELKMLRQQDFSIFEKNAKVIKEKDEIIARL